MKTSDCNLPKRFAWLAVFLLISYVIPWCLVLIKKLEYGTYGEALALYMMILPTIGVLTADAVTKELKDHIVFRIYVCVFALTSFAIILVIFNIISVESFEIMFEVISFISSITVLGYLWMNNESSLSFNVLQFIILLIGTTFICIVPTSFLEKKGWVETGLLFFQCCLYYPLVLLLFNGITLFGEEYCWRGRLLMKLSARFGRRAGTILIGIIWELWHVPLWFALYSVQFQNISIAFFAFSRFTTTISIGIFLAYVYFRTKSVWFCSIIHGLYDVIAQTYIFENLKYTINSGLLVSSLVFVFFIFSKHFKDNSHIQGDKIEE